MSIGTDALSFQVARVRLQLMLLLSFPLPTPVHVRARISEPGGHPSGEGRQSHGPASEKRDRVVKNHEHHKIRARRRCCQPSQRNNTYFTL